MARIRIEVQGYWHAGSGRGAGPGADAVVVRTPAGLPYLPGRALKGLIRDAARIAEQAGRLDQGRTASLFGGRSRGAAEGAGKGMGRFGVAAGALRFSDARIGVDDDKQQIWEDWADTGRGRKLVGGLFDHISSTAMDENGLADERTLRTVEVTVPMQLHAFVEPIPDNDPGDWQSDLRLVLPLIRTLGSKRSRGFGRCSMSLLDGGGR